MNAPVNEITRELAEFAGSITFDSLPDEVIQMAKCAVIDFVGCALRGSVEAVTEIIGEELFAEKLTPKQLFSAGIRHANPTSLARLYAVAGHAIDYDDTHPHRGMHTGSPVIGAVLAVAGTRPITGEEVITAVVAGYEVAIRVGNLLDIAHYQQGFHTTGTVAIFGAAVAVARLLNLNTEQMRQVLGLATTQAAGVKCTFGTMAKPFNAGAAAANGLLAASLISRGFTAPISSLEESKGFLDLYGGLDTAECNLPAPDNWLILENVFKLHAACLATHPMIFGLERLREAQNFRVEDIESVLLKVAPLALATASIIEPQSPLDGKFCFPQIASLVIAGWDTSSEQSFSSEALVDTEVVALRRKISVESDSEIDARKTRVEIILRGGDVISLDADIDQGPSTLKDIAPLVEAKFLSNAGYVLGDERAESVLKVLTTIEKADSLIL